MLHRLFIPVPLLIGALASCGQTPPPPPRPVVVTIAPSASVAPPVASARAEPAPAPKPEPTPPEADEPPPRNKVALTLEPGKPPCTLVIDGGLFQDQPEWFVVTSVSRMATEESGGCAASVFYDLSKETKSDPDEMDPESLTAGIFRKPGQKMPPDMEDATIWNVTEDLNFDGAADLCVVSMTGAYNYSQLCWLFDTKSRTFVRHAEIDPIIFMGIDRKKKRLGSFFRAGGPIYEKNEYEWHSGKLVKVLGVTTYLGERPDGKPLNPGFDRWEVRYELRKGTLVKTFEGAMREKP